MYLISKLYFIAYLPVLPLPELCEYPLKIEFAFTVDEEHDKKLYSPITEGHEFSGTPIAGDLLMDSHD